MNNKIILCCLIMFSFFVYTDVYAKSDNFKFNMSDLSFTASSKKNNIIGKFNGNYNLEYSIDDSNIELEEKIRTLTKKTTYLLFGKPGDFSESSEEYYNRHKDWLKLRYNPSIPKDDNNILGIDTTSQEYKDDIVSGIAIPQMFNKVSEFGMVYNSYGNITVSISNDVIISSILLPDVKVKQQSKSDPMLYEYVETNYIMYYFYKKLNNKWKLYYLYGEDIKDISDYVSNSETKKLNDNVSVFPLYESKLSDIYNFDKVNNLSLSQLNDIYNMNIDKVVFLNGYYNNSIVSSANGFFISDGLLVTTWNFLEESLINAQGITIKDNSDNYFELDGIVTVNLDADICVLKVKSSNLSGVKLGNSKLVKVEDPVISINSRGLDFAIKSGIVISNDNYIKTSIPIIDNEEGSPLLNKDGDVIGLNSSKLKNTSVSIFITSDILNKIQNKFNNVSYDKIKTISFDDLKKKYYYVKFNDEVVKKTIPNSKWKTYSKIGNIKDTIKLNLVKASFVDGIVSLRYKNEISQYIGSMQFSLNFRDQLLNDGYKVIFNSDSKIIYKNDEYQVIIMDEFDYLIVVMVRL